MFVRAIMNRVCLVAGLGLAGCGNSTPAPSAPSGTNAKSNSTPAALTSTKAHQVLASEPAGAKGVIDVRKGAKDGDDVVVVGRIGGDVKAFVEGRASFSIVDSSLKPCNEKGDDGCKTPWDYCCDTDALPKSMATVKFTNAEGQTVGTDARQLLGVKELQTVVVKGKAKRDDAGNLTIIAEGLFVKD